MLNFLWILGATLLVSLCGLVGVLSLWIKEKLLRKLIVGLVAFSAGTLIGGAFFHLLVESLEGMSSLTTFVFAVLGFLLFFIIEGYFHWHLCEKCDEHPFTYLMLVGDAVHNFIDGIVIAATFSASIYLGVITTLIIIGHELPQQIGLFGVLVYGKHKKNKAVLYSFLAQLTVILGGLIGFLISGAANSASAFLVPFAAGGFIYIAASDLVPEMHNMYRGNFKRSLEVISFFLVGLGFMLSVKLFLGA